MRGLLYNRAAYGFQILTSVRQLLLNWYMVATYVHTDGLNIVVNVVPNGVLTPGIKLTTMFRQYLVLKCMLHLVAIHYVYQYAY